VSHVGTALLAQVADKVGLTLDAARIMTGALNVRRRRTGDAGHSRPPHRFYAKRAEDQHRCPPVPCDVTNAATCRMWRLDPDRVVAAQALSTKSAHSHSILFHAGLSVLETFHVC